MKSVEIGDGIMSVSIQYRRNKARKKIGLALSGGGLRGMAHIGVLKVFDDNKIPIDMISGTSAGAIVATMYACGYSPKQMQKIAENVKINDLIDLKVKVSDLFKHGLKWLFSGKFRFWSVLPSGLITGNKIEDFFFEYWQYRTVRNTEIPLAITAVDINSGDTVFFSTPVQGSRTILNARYYHNTLLTEAVRASISIPGIFLPKKYRSMTLVDGAVKNNLPTDILHHMGADIIIAVDLGYAGQPNYDLAAVGEILLQCIEIMGREVTLLKGEQYANLIIRPAVYNFAFHDTSQIALCIEQGEQAAQAKITDLKQLLWNS